jgi:serine/threonine-protein kinase RsbW
MPLEHYLYTLGVSVAVIEDVDIKHSPLVKLTGDVDSAGSENMADVLMELHQSGCAAPRFDLSEVSFMDSAGLMAVIQWCRQFQDKEGDLEVVSVNPLVRRLFEIAGYTHVIHGSEERSIQPPPVRHPITDCMASTADWEIRSFSVPARLDSCKIVRDRISQTMVAMSFSEEDKCDVKLAVGEAISNAIRHGACEKPWETVTVRTLATAHKLVVEITDPGDGFNLNEATNSSLDTGLPEGNMGIKCMQHCMDEVSFHFSPGTTVRLIKTISP